jgi:hypothetical protein
VNNPPLAFGKRATASVITFGCIFIAQAGIDLLLLQGIITPVKAQLYTEHGQLVHIYRTMLATNEVDRIDQLNTAIGLALIQSTNLVATLEAFPITIQNQIQVADLLLVAQNSLIALKQIM